MRSKLEFRAVVQKNSFYVFLLFYIWLPVCLADHNFRSTLVETIMKYILGQLWCLIVSIPDICLLSYFYSKS